MILLPAIDLLDGRVVRLYQGDYAEVSDYGEDPLAFAAKYQQQGAAFLHLVDLNGARSGRPQHLGQLKEIASLGLFVEYGGGVRNEQTVYRCFEMGAGRVVLGTAALQTPDFAKKMLAAYPGRIAVGVDARGGKVSVEGWTQTSEQDSFAFCQEMRLQGAEHVIYTDISRDGAGLGANLAAYARLSEIEGLLVTASGGVTSLQELAALSRMGLYGAIVGKALYTGKINLEQAIKMLADDCGKEQTQ